MRVHCGAASLGRIEYPDTMHFYRAYLQALLWRPHLAIEALYWHLSGRKVRARNRLRIAASEAPGAYATWIDQIERQVDTVRAAPARIARWNTPPRFSAVLYNTSGTAPADHDATIASVALQSYDEFELLVVTGEPSWLPSSAVPRIVPVPARDAHAGEALALGIAAATGDYLVPLVPGTVLPPSALFHYAEALVQAPGAGVLYGDHDALARTRPFRRTRRCRPWFKPQWNAEMFLAQDYVSPACAIAVDAARAALEHTALPAQAPAYALLLEIAATPDPAIVHVPHITAHVAAGSDADAAARREVVARHVASRHATAEVGPFGTVRVDWPLPASPPVSIIVPTRDKVKLLRACCTGVLTKTDYPAFELIVVDNASREPETLRYLDQLAGDPRVRVLVDPRPFNFSAINNRAVAAVEADYVCLLNNDIEVLESGWLTALMRQAVRREIGAAGAKLLYDDGTIQHAGVVVGLGDAAGHAHRYQENRTHGYFAQAHVARYTSAVTAACLAIGKAKFDAVGGLDEAELAIAFNDVDLCLKLERMGWRNVYVPQATLLHHESKSRGRDFLPKNIERYQRELAVLQRRWGTASYGDPLHHPSLDRVSETYRLQL